jgi:hypothetical protein
MRKIKARAGRGMMEATEMEGAMVRRWEDEKKMEDGKL